MGILNLDDIQGNILRGYNFNAGIHYFARFGDIDNARALLRDLLPELTTAREWSTPPVITLNVALTFAGLKALGVERSILETLPEAFREPIRQRAAGQLGDDPGEWEPGLGAPDTHALILLATSEPRRTPGRTLRARFPHLASAAAWVTRRVEDRAATCVYRQDVEALSDKQREHFGFADGFGQPAVEGMSNNRPGQGTPDPETGAWSDIKAGEFVLGYPNEDGECDTRWLLYDGSYMVYRKLEQNVSRFRRLVSAQGQAYARAQLKAGKLTTPLSDVAAFELMAAKLVGRWRDGQAIELEPGPDRDEDLRPQGDRYVDNDFRYRADEDEDLKGTTCPLGAHVRRANPRDMLGRQYNEARRHRIIRRGVPYGPPYDDWDRQGEATPSRDNRKRGLIFTCFNSDLERQFEFIQGHWCNDGNDFGLGGDQDFMLGSKTTGKLTIEGDPPFFVRRDSRLVITRGCEYGLMPGLAALERLAAPRSRVSRHEQIPPEEPAATHDIVELVLGQMHQSYAQSRPMRRGQHPKTHACLKAEFIVKDVPEDLRVGVFDVDRERTYEAWIRFSASHQALQSDAAADAQGMAIKLVGVEGEKVLPQERCMKTQDFVLVNHRVFFLRDAAAVAAFAQAITSPSRLPVQLRAAEFFLCRGDPRGLRILEQTVGKTAANPLDLEYWSQTPYALGDVAVKYAVKPLRRIGRPGPAPTDWDALEDTVRKELTPLGAEFWFEFLVQLQMDPGTMPIEDPTMHWNERDAPYRRVALIRIAHQDFTTQQSRSRAENMSFTPWHTRWEHRPLGGINRVRRAVYEASSRRRHEHNGAPLSEPGGVLASCPPRMPNPPAGA